ncbi:bifunctional folylpolyglutamate synthase/dihydrofolate synthase [Limosilactobacillus sp. BG-MG3-A]|uniref:tetrahydrofolate synthase n=1 Tax=Limosilactobacillus agrestis TaxID=2759748 RepID=A0A7W3UGE6_9LACO|nr:folylpolyglutamate synthase/dihydrofolate synthase family protein [Limosilactobacillus agrestis]MBD5091178.1 bifunctional folylpolyglutamate synthase/dihydrofolate synthase [Lactobacillus sp.]MBB1095112.1 bifunctional folylpolyglutamate synthase/dihydrofolate synthase [Limosilactobacillus agrestis]MBB1099000.1 bifunctional folylpolyglutamate synthase/dihydrofolate synthase [Limosilactobacillus agrestis]MCD7119302.1 bifunctional folylpolyglutamate synthase/dihydrofolate synthase [Limosilactob
MIKTYDEALSFIHGRTQFKKIPTLTRMKRFLAELGNPQENLKYIHVTGTNGKGSTVAMLRSTLLESGLTVGSFTSPFITRFNERIAYNGIPISDEDLLRLVQKIVPVIKKLDAILETGGPTEFEIDTALMFCYMAEKKPDVVLLEVGIGGLYDSTNVITPVVSVITTVGWDHMKYLGDTLAKIATQKAGIIKKGVPVVLGNLPTEARATILADAKEKDSPVFELGKDFNAHQLNVHQFYAKIQYQGRTLKKIEAVLGLAGDYQIENAAVALMAFEIFMEKCGLAIDRHALVAALANTKWPGRLEEVNEMPLVLLDGAHNLPGVQALVRTIKNDFADREVYLLVAILADKQYELMLGELASLGNVHLNVTHFAGPGPKRPSADLARAVADIPTKYPIQIIDNWQLGIGKIARQMSEDDVMIITGSLYFVSDVRKLFLN